MIAESKRTTAVMLLMTAVLLFLSTLFLGGCTEYERRGYSPIPQNRPSGWEYQPYGAIRN